MSSDFLARYEKANEAPTMLFEITVAGPKVIRALYGDRNREDAQAAITSVSPVSGKIHEITRKKAIDGLSITFQDDGLYRDVVSTYVLRGAPVSVKLGFEGMSLVDYAPLFGGRITGIPHKENELVYKLKSNEIAYKETIIDGDFLDHPLDVISLFLTAAGLSFTAAEFDPSIPAHSAISHWMVQRYNRDTNAARGPNAIVEPEAIKENIDDLTQLLQSTLAIDEFGEVRFKIYDDTESTVDDWGDDDIVQLDVVSLIDNIKNRVEFTVLDGFGELLHGPIESGTFGVVVRADDAASQAAFGELPLKVSTRWLRNVAIIASEPGNDLVGAPPLTLFVGHGSEPWQGFSGMGISVANREIIFAPVPPNPVGTLTGFAQETFRQVGVGGRFAHIYVQNRNGKPGEIFRVSLVEPFTDVNSLFIDYVHVYPDGIAGARRTDKLPRRSELTLDQRGVLGTPNLDASIEADPSSARCFDVTIPVQYVQQLLRRFANGAPKLRVTTALNKYRLQLGDFLTLTDDVYINFGADGLDSATVWEVIGKEVDATESGLITWDLLWVRDSTGPTVRTLTAEVMQLGIDSHADDAARGLGAGRISGLGSSEAGLIATIAEGDAGTLLEKRFSEEASTELAPGADNYIFAGRFGLASIVVDIGDPQPSDEYGAPLFKYKTDATSVLVKTDLRAPPGLTGPAIADGAITPEKTANLNPVFRFVPGEPADVSNSQYDTWDALKSAVEAYPDGRKWVQIDDRSGAVAMVAGAHAFEGVIFEGRQSTGAYLSAVTLTIPEGVTFTGDPPELGSLVRAVFTGAAPPISILAGVTRIGSVGWRSSWEASGAGPVFSVADGGILQLNLRGGKLLNAGNPVVSVTGSGILVTELYEGRTGGALDLTISASAITGTGGWVVRRYTAAGDVSDTQPGHSGTRSNERRFSRLVSRPTAGAAALTGAAQTVGFGESLRVDPSVNPITVTIAQKADVLPGGDLEIVIDAGTFPTLAANAVTIVPPAGETIDGAATFPLTLQRQNVVLRSSGGLNWPVVAHRISPSGGGAPSIFGQDQQYTSDNIFRIIVR